MVEERKLDLVEAQCLNNRGSRDWQEKKSKKHKICRIEKCPN